MSKPSSRADPRLPMLRTVYTAYATTFRHLADFVRISWAWLLALTVLVAAIAGFFWPSHQAALQSGKPISWVQIATSLVSIVAGSSIAVRWHRLILQGERPVGSLRLRLDSPVRRYLLIVGLMLLPFYAPLLLLDGMELETEQGAHTMLVKMLMSLAIMLIGIIIAVKASVMLPAVALSRSDVTLGSAWRATAWNWWRLFFGFVLTTLPPALVLFLPSLLRNWNWDSDGVPPPETHLGFIATSLETEIGTVLAGLVALSFLSLAFRHFFPGPQRPDAT